MKFSICHPSYLRPVFGTDNALDIINKSSKKHEVEYFLTLSENDTTIEKYKERIEELKIPLKVVVDKNSNWVSAINSTVPLMTGEIIIVAADDFIFPDKWDELLYDVIKKNGKFNGDFVIAISDVTKNARLLTLPICSMKYYKRMGYMMYHEYESMYADNDFTEVAYRQKRVIEARHLEFKHDHYSRGGKIGFDESYKQSNSRERMQKGKIIFNQRASRNFDLKK